MWRVPVYLMETTESDPHREKNAAHRKESSASQPVRCSLGGGVLSHLRHEAAHGSGCLILLLPRGVGVGAEGKPCVVVAKHGGHGLDVHAVLKG